MNEAVWHGAEWVELVVRWIHVITGVAWIGTSFYFNWINDHIREPEGEAPPGVKGELWSVHGGGFYRVLKYAVAPEKLPRTLHWFKWEAYFTWISGFALLALVYYLGADVYLLEPSAPVSLGPWAAIGVGVGSLVAGWIVYDLLCKSPLSEHPAVLGVLGLALVTGAAFGLLQVFSPRGAYIHVGALLGTIMAANVFFVIIPNQKKMVSAMERGEEPDAEEGGRAAMRSRHNNYITLPVLFIMVSNHYPLTYGHEWSWAILAALSVVGAGVRHWFNVRNMGRHNRWILPAAALAMVGLAFVTLPRKPGAAEARGATQEASFQRVASILTNRCAECHSQTPTNELFVAPPGGITFATPEEIADRAPLIYGVVVGTHTMPPGNRTGMTEAERHVIRRWFEGGAPTHGQE